MFMLALLTIFFNAFQGKTGNNDNRQNNRKDTKFQEAGINAEVTDNGETKNTRGTEDLRGNVGEVQGRRSVRQGNDNRTGEGRNGQDAMEGRSEGDGKNLSLLIKKRNTRHKWADRKNCVVQLKRNHAVFC